MIDWRRLITMILFVSLSAMMYIMLIQSLKLWLSKLLTMVSGLPIGHDFSWLFLWGGYMLACFQFNMPATEASSFWHWTLEDIITFHSSFGCVCHFRWHANLLYFIWKWYQLSLWPMLCLERWMLHYVVKIIIFDLESCFPFKIFFPRR